jgi:NDP-sugar pyrophosphorylase family protein
MIRVSPMLETPRKIQLVIPMAGLGSRFSKAGYTVPKPLIQIHGFPMYKVVINNLMHESIVSLTIVCPRKWDLPREIVGLESAHGVPVNIVEVDELTEGPASTVWLAKPHLNLELPVVVANSDQYIDADLSGFYDRVSGPGSSSVILCMEDSDKKWSYVRQSSSGLVEEVREKEVISNVATVGIYGFSSATVMLEAFQEMFSAKDSTLGEYYVAPAYNYIIKQGHPVSVVNLGPVGRIMHGLGVPIDFELFLQKPVSRLAVERIQNIR